MDTTTMNSFIKSKSFIAIIITVGMLAVIASAFSAGMAIGYQKARGSYAWGENYHRTFAGPRDGFMKGFTRNFEGGDFMESGGTFGFVLKIEGQLLVVSGRDGTERVVSVLPDTVVRKYRDDISLSGIAVYYAIVVIGESDPSGEIQARLIRVMPTAPITPDSAMPPTPAYPR